MIKSKYFKEAEFARLGCSLQDMKQDFMDMLDECRELAGIPFVMTSAYRAPEHNEEVGGVPGSAHPKGRAADIKALNGTTRWKIVYAAILVGFRRIGIGRNFVHLDNDDSLPHPVMFDYYND